MADPETMQSRPPLETNTTRQARNVPIGAYVVDQVEYVAEDTAVDKERDLYVVDTTDASVTVTLPALSTVASGKAYTFYKPVAANNLVIEGYDTEQIEGAANETRSAQYSVVTIRKVQIGTATFAWMLVKADLAAGSIADDAVGNAQLADDAVDSPQIADGAVDPVHLASVAITPAADAAAAILNTTTEMNLTVTAAGNVAISTTSSVAGQEILLRAVAVAGGGSYTLVTTGGTLTLNSTGETALVKRNAANNAWLVVSLTSQVSAGAPATVV
jgi:hypothetical protein